VAQFTFGPVEFYLLGLEGEKPSPELLGELRSLIESGTLRLLDFVIVSKSQEGDVTVTEVDAETIGLGGIEVYASGLAGDEDVDELAPLVEPGKAAALVVIELAWAKRLAEAAAATGAEVLSVERIPAPVVNALVDSLDA
jgi:hypothetical protein